MASLGFRSFLDSPIFESIEIGMQDTIVLVSTLPVLWSHRFDSLHALHETPVEQTLKHAWLETALRSKSTSYLLLSWSHSMSTAFWCLEFLSLCVTFFFLTHMPVQNVPFATEFTNCILSCKLVTEWTSSLHQTQDSIWLLAVCIWFGLKLLFPVSIPLQSSNQLLYLKTNQRAYSDTSALYKETCFSVMALALLLSSCEKSYTCNWRKDKTRQDNFI